MSSITELKKVGTERPASPPPPPKQGPEHRPPRQERRRFYVPLHVKFVLSVSAAIGWTLFSIWAAQPWLEDMGKLTSPLVAVVVISFIAFVPGFMNTFLMASLLMDHRPIRRDIATYPGVTMLIPAFNEEHVIAQTLTDVAALRYDAPLEVLIVNDGSTDGTVQRVLDTIARLELPPQMTMRLVDFPQNQGKANALNKALAQAKHDLICTIDADSRPRPEAMRQLVGRLLSDPPNTQAVAGSVLVSNSRDSLLAAAQEWDYFHGIAAVKRMQSMYNGTLVAQGAFSLYRKAAIEKVGGWPNMVGEDIGLTWAMLNQGYRIGYAEDAIIWTVVPTTFRQFAKQRKRWSRGMIEALKQYGGGLLFRPRMTTLFIWWNLLFMPLDLTYTFVFIPGLVAALFGVFWIAGPMTLAVLPLAALGNIAIFKIQLKMFHRQGLHVRRHYGGLAFFVLAYSLMMQPICVWGYVSELLRMRKSWGTK